MLLLVTLHTKFKCFVLSEVFYFLASFFFIIKFYFNLLYTL